MFNTLVEKSPIGFRLGLRSDPSCLMDVDINILEEGTPIRSHSIKVMTPNNLALICRDSSLLADTWNCKP